MDTAALVLAAGESSRMGRPKALLDWGGTPLLQHQVDQLVEAGCDPIVVVVGARAQQVRARLRRGSRCRVVENAAYRSGRASSVRVGARALPDAVDAVVVASVDGPLTATTVRALMDERAHGGAAIVVPRHEGRNGHPALFGGELLGELREVTEAGEGLRTLRRAHADATTFLDVDDPRVLLNLNTPDEYASAAKRWVPGRASGGAPGGEEPRSHRQS